MTDPKAAPETIGFHLHELAGRGEVAERRAGVSQHWTLTDAGLAALAVARQHETATFTLDGKTLNALLGAGPRPGDRRAPGPATGTESQAEAGPAFGASEVEGLVESLKAGEFSGKPLIPIPAVRRLAADRFGAEAASHPVFDRLLKAMRVEGRIRLTSIGNLADATEADLDAAIPGANETIFYIMVR